MTIIPGETIGPYRIIEQLGSGGMATVFKAYHPALDRYVAIKVLHPAFKANPQFFERFKREARIVANLEHAHIIPIYDFSEHNGEPYLVMRFVAGDTLKPELEGQPVAPKDILRLMRPICRALSYAHRQGVLHRDIKPSNVMVSEDGTIFLTDFGLARMVEVGESTLSQDMLVGTPQYISPEQAQGVKNLDGRTDIYSLGVILFEMFTGRVPFNADTPFATVHNHIYAPLPLPSSINPSIQPDIERLLLKALAKDPDDRFQTADDLLATLESTLSGQPDTPNITEPITVGAKKSTIPWWGWVGGVAVILLICMLIAMLAVQRARLRNASMSDRSQASATQPAAGLPAQELAGQAAAAAQQGNFDEAVELYQQAITADPAYLPAYWELSELYQAREETGRAVGVLKRAVENNPDEALAHTRLGEALLFNAEDPQAAQAAFEQAAELQPNAARPHAGQALALLMQGQNQQAKAAIDTALAIDPDSTEAQLANAMYLARQGNRLAAVRQFRAIIQDNQTSANLRARAEFLLERLGRN